IVFYDGGKLSQCRSTPSILLKQPANKTPNIFDQKNPPENSAENENPTRKNIVEDDYKDDGFGEFERHTKGVGLRILEKHGFKDRLGAGEDGRLNPVLPHNVNSRCLGDFFKAKNALLLSSPEQSAVSTEIEDSSSDFNRKDKENDSDNENSDFGEDDDFFFKVDYCNNDIKRSPDINDIESPDENGSFGKTEKDTKKDEKIDFGEDDSEANWDFAKDIDGDQNKSYAEEGFRSRKSERERREALRTKWLRRGEREMAESEKLKISQTVENCLDRAFQSDGDVLRCAQVVGMSEEKGGGEVAQNGEWGDPERALRSEESEEEFARADRDSDPFGLLDAEDDMEFEEPDSDPLKDAYRGRKFFC
ncbi:hypothetical protein MHBO_003394, partial [Bonamia ostreae]